MVISQSVNQSISQSLLVFFRSVYLFSLDSVCLQSLLLSLFFVCLCLCLSIFLFICYFFSLLYSLYPTACANDGCPWKDFKRLYLGCPNFQFISERLTSLDVEWFCHQAEQEKKGYIFEVTLDYDYQTSLCSSIDLGAIPFLRKCHMSELSVEQQEDLISQGRKPNHSAIQLTSNHDIEHLRVEFSYNLIYMMLNQGFSVKKIHCILSFTTENLLGDYLDFLQKGRQKSTSPLLARLIKNLGNAIPGKTDRRTDRQTDRQTNTKNKEKRERERERERNKQTERQTYKQTNREKERNTNRQTQTDRKTNKVSNPLLTCRKVPSKFEKLQKSNMCHYQTAVYESRYGS